MVSIIIHTSSWKKLREAREVIHVIRCTVNVLGRLYRSIASTVFPNLSCSYTLLPIIIDSH